MSRRNEHVTPTEQALDEARREHSRRSPGVAAAAACYRNEMVEQIIAQVKQGASRTQRRWDRDGTPLLMRIKTALGLAGRRG